MLQRNAVKGWCKKVRSLLIGLILEITIAWIISGVKTQRSFRLLLMAFSIKKSNRLWKTNIIRKLHLEAIGEANLRPISKGFWNNNFSRLKWHQIYKWCQHQMTRLKFKVKSKNTISKTHNLRDLPSSIICSLRRRMKIKGQSPDTLDKCLDNTQSN